MIAREIDGLIHLHVMEHKETEIRWDAKLQEWVMNGPMFIPRYSSQIIDAWRVVEKLLSDGHNFTLDSGPNRETGGIFHSARVDDVDLTYGDSAPMVICISALKAYGIEVSE